MLASRVPERRGESKMKALSQITKALWILPAWASVSLVGAATYACPICDSETGVQVRASLLNEDFGANFLATVLPFVVALGFAAMTHHGGVPRRSNHAADVEPRSSILLRSSRRVHGDRG